MIVINKKTVDIDSVEIDGIDTKDYPDFCNAYVSSANFLDGSDLSEDECDLLQKLYPQFVYSLILDRIF